MKQLFSAITKTATKKRSLGALHRVEETVTRRFTPSDWAIAGFFLALMSVGALLLFIHASLAFSVEVPAKGGTHIEGVVGTPRFINPLLATSETDSDLTELVFGGLLKANPDGTLSPNLAESYTVSPDQLLYTFKIRDDATFHDGTPVTAEDVVFTVQAAKNPDIKSPRRANWDGVDAVAVDEKTVTFSLKVPYALFLENATMGILPKHIWGGVTPEEFPFSEYNQDPVGAGPFQVEHIKKNGSGVPTEYRLKAYDRAPNAPYIRTFIFRFYPNQDALAAALEKGDVDAAHSIVPEADEKNVSVNEVVFGRVFGVFFNQNQNQIFADKAVRQALDADLDKDALISTILSGYGTPLTGPLPPLDVVSPDTGSGDASAAHEKARAILEQDGWEVGDDGVYVKKTKDATTRLSFSIATGNAPELKAAAEFVAASWKEMGADVTVQLFDTNDLNLEVIRPRKYDALLFGMVVGRELDLFPFWHSSQRNDPGLNVGLYANIVTDSLLEEARKEEDPILRRQKAAEAAQEITNDAAAVFLYAPHFLYLTEKELKGVQLGTVSTPSDRFYGVENWYLKTEGLWPLFR